VVENHPVQYHAPVYCAVQQKFGIPVTAVYGSDFSVRGYRDPEFGVHFSWDTDLLSGYTAQFLSSVGSGKAASFEEAPSRSLARMLEASRPKALLVSGYMRPVDRAAFFWGLRARIPTLFRAETTDHAIRRGPAKAWIRDQLLRQFYGRCAALLYIGKHSYQHYRRLGCPDRKLVFSPYAVDDGSFRCDESARAQGRETTRASLGFSPEHKVILFSGKLVARKRPDLLLKAAGHLSKSGNGPWALLFMGDGELRAELEEGAGTFPELPCRFIGFKNQTQMSPFYHAADLMVLPSAYSEPWGLVVNDALHHGVPCVVSEAVGCAPDLVKPGTTGEVFATDSLEQLESALLKMRPLLGDPGLRRQCRERVGGYTIGKAAEGIAKAYGEVTR